MALIPDAGGPSSPAGDLHRALAGRESAGSPGPVLVDGFGRTATDLRISLTDRCNLRCSYCMPAEGAPWCPAENLLTDDEMIRLITIAVRDLGVRQVRFTGGEPLLRDGLERIVAATTSLRTLDGQVPTTALTTNGVLLERRARSLREAGLRRVNVSLDTLDRARYARLTRRDRLPEVIAGLRAAAAAGLEPVKINAVLLRGVNEDEAVSLVRWALQRGYQPRFIEQMPLGPQGAWDRDQMVSAAEILDLLRAELTLVPAHPAMRGADPAETWIVSNAGSPAGRSPADRSPAGEAYTVGIVASVTRPFCGSCDRTRLTADGQLRTCLFARGETDLRALLRGEASDREIAATWRETTWVKQRGHGIDGGEFLQPERPMSSIGG